MAEGGGVVRDATLMNITILAKRTHLFSLKSQMRFMDQDTNAKLTPSYPEIIKFPPLMWVVEDFFQDLLGQSATDWVQSLLEARPRDAHSSAQTSLQGLFPSIEAHTLFLPSVIRTKLQNLNGITDDELHPEYKAGVAELRAKV